jgi:cyclopropane-fatty-acyl-phospholipid synthase
LRLRPGEKFLDIGCGWGSLVIHAAKNYGVYAHGITLSRNQARYARKRIIELGLEGRCKVEVKDYRDMDKFNYYDKISSIGMFEHVGRKMYPIYMKKAFDLLKEGGAFLNHGISIDIDEYSKPKSEFIQKYVFPDGELLPISFVIEQSEKAGFEIRDVENLREHYALTLRHWVNKLESNYREALKYVSEERYRIWRLYMAASAYNFERGKIAVYQTLLVKRTKDGKSCMPLTRSDWYE